MAYDRAPFDKRKAVEQRFNSSEWDILASTRGNPGVRLERWLRAALPTLFEEVEVQHRLHAEAWDHLRRDDAEG